MHAERIKKGLRKRRWYKKGGRHKEREDAGKFSREDILLRKQKGEWKGGEADLNRCTEQRKRLRRKGGFAGRDLKHPQKEGKKVSRFFKGQRKKKQLVRWILRKKNRRKI